MYWSAVYVEWICVFDCVRMCAASTSTAAVAAAALGLHGCLGLSQTETQRSTLRRRDEIKM